MIGGGHLFWLAGNLCIDNVNGECNTIQHYIKYIDAVISYRYGQDLDV